MNPYHYTVFHENQGYEALTRARDKQIKGIIVTRKDSALRDISELEGKHLAFPSPAAFAASILPQGELKRRNINYIPRYVSSHDSVYRTVAKGLFPAGGGVVRTFMAVEPEIREQLQIFWKTPGYTPHAIAAHPRVSRELFNRIQQVLIGMEKTPEGQRLLEPLKIKGWHSANDSDWDDVRKMDIHNLEVLKKE
jgi:phosphonate transport system substrate-binding protein